MRAALAATTDFTLRTLRQLSHTLLTGAGIDRAEREVVWLLEAALGYDRLAQLLESERSLDPTQWDRALALVSRRAAREPLQYLLGTQEFCGHDFAVEPAVLIPRPETEVLVRVVAGHCRSHGARRVADVGTGSGCIGVSLALEMPDLRVVLTDRSRDALAVARRNAQRHRIDGRIRLLQGDLLQPLRADGPRGLVDVVLSNPPYIADSVLASLEPEVRDYEPWLALCGGPDGLVFHRRLLEEAPSRLSPGGLLALEVGAQQATGLVAAAARSGVYGRIWTVQDDLGIDRVVCCQTASHHQR